MNRILVRALGVLLLAAFTAGAADLRLLSTRKIWDHAPHNAFTDLIRWQDRWWCVFREGAAHVSPDGALRILSSADGSVWHPAARITMDGVDLRDAKIGVTPRGELMLNGAGAFPAGGPVRHRSFAWFSRDGSTWSPPTTIGDPDFWLWRVTWNAGAAWSLGYGTVGPSTVRLYRSPDGREYSTVVGRFPETEGPSGQPNEHALVFDPDGTAWCLLRRDGSPAHGLLGSARGPEYRDWTWRETDRKIGGPALIRMPDGRMLAAVRLYDRPVRTSLCWLDTGSARLTEALSLPSGGDTSYAGMVWHKDRLWVSYYSSHEGKTAIYLAVVGLEETPR